MITAASFPFLWLIPALPLFGALVNGLLGARLQRAVGPKANHTIAIALPAASCAVSAWAVWELWHLDQARRALHQYLFPFIHVGFFDADMAFWLDPLSGTMALIITGIGTLIHVYSVGYMKGDPSYWRFFTYMNLFTGSMLLLVLADNFLVMFIGWEGVGLCSYLLISFWYRHEANATAGMKAFVVNRVGDFGFIVGVALLFWALMGSHGGALGTTDSYRQGEYQLRPVGKQERLELYRQYRGHFEYPDDRKRVMASSVRFDSVRARVLADRAQFAENAPATKRFMGVPVIVLICLLMFLGACGKSAQIPLYVWLPDAMAGPTPVSALIHAATMVTAGVYLVARLNFLYAMSPTAMTVVAAVGAVTALYAATIGLFQYDIKKVLAYSTVSQLGYMFIGVGVGAYWVGIYHLLTHAVFKALLFLGSGSVILGCHHEQDMRKMGGLKKFMPVTHWTYFAACVAITTAPFFFLSNGFFSKDEILWKAFDAHHLLVPGWWIWLLGFVGAGLTSFYMWRSYYMTFTGEYRGETHDGMPHESPRSITWVLSALAALIVLTIPLGAWPLVFHNEPLVEQWLAPVLHFGASMVSWSDPHDVASVEWALAGGSVGLALIVWLAARVLYKDAANPIPARLSASESRPLRFVHSLIFNKYYIDELYAWAIVRRVRALSRALFTFDQKVIDGLVHFIAWLGRGVAAVDGLIDALVVDGAVNGLAAGTRAVGSAVRRTQTGRIQTYLFGAAAGAVALVFINFMLF